MKQVRPSRLSGFLWGALICAFLMLMWVWFMPIGASKAETITVINRHAAKSVGESLLAYAADHDEVLPGMRWADAAAPYMGNPDDLLKPPGRPKDKYRFAFNSLLAGARISTLPVPDASPLIFNSCTALRNAAGGLELFQDKPEIGFPAIAFANGKAKVIKSGEIDQYDWSPSIESIDGVAAQ